MSLSVVVERLKVRFLARLKAESLLRKEDQEGVALGGSHAAVQGGTRATPVEPRGPMRKPPYLHRSYRLKTEKSLKLLEERSVAETDMWEEPPRCPLTRGFGVRLHLWLPILATQCQLPQWSHVLKGSNDMHQRVKKGQK